MPGTSTLPAVGKDSGGSPSGGPGSGPASGKDGGLPGADGSRLPRVGGALPAAGAGVGADVLPSQRNDAMGRGHGPLGGSLVLGGVVPLHEVW